MHSPLKILLLSAAVCIPAIGQSAFKPQPILQGGLVMPLFPPDSHYLNTNRIAEAEIYNAGHDVAAQVQSIVNIHNPSIEVHLVDRSLNTGAAVILAAGGGHNTLNVGGEGADFVLIFLQLRIQHKHS